MTQPIQAVFFDLDGTLIDTAPDFVRIIQQMCADEGRPAPSEAAIREQVSAGARAMVQLMFAEQLGQICDDDLRLLSRRQAFLDRYEIDVCVDSRVFEGLEVLLEKLEVYHIPWGIVTNKPRYLAENLLDKLNLSSRCGVLVCPDDVKNPKPNPEPLYLACQKIGVEPFACIYIGDHRRDIEAGRAAGMQTAIAGFGYLSAADLASIDTWGADVIMQTPKALTDWVLQQVL